MNHRDLLLLSTLVTVVSMPVPARAECTVRPDASGRVSEAAWRRCIDAAVIARPRPALSVEELRRGPGGSEAIPPDQTVHCKFIPYEMHLKSRGRSRKFWCHRTDERGRYLNERAVVVPEARSVSRDGFLVDARGAPIRDDDGAFQRPDVIKVKYTDGGNRGREVFTEVAVSRFLWALGFPADLMYPARVRCDGCSEDPFDDVRTDEDNHPVNASSFFPTASVERKLATSIELEADAGWDWDDVYESARWDHQRRIEFQAYVLALNMVNFHNGRAKQNSLGCERGFLDRATGRCRRSTLYLDDLGATFGGGKSRGSLDRFREITVFRPGTCELRSDLAGFERPSDEALRLLAARLGVFDEAFVRALFEVSGFDDVNTDGSLDGWVAAFRARIREVVSPRCRSRSTESP